MLRTVSGTPTAGTSAGLPQARQSRVFPTEAPPAVRRRPQTGQGKRIFASAATGGGAAPPPAVLPHLGQPALLASAS